MNSSFLIKNTISKPIRDKLAFLRLPYYTHLQIIVTKEKVYIHINVSDVKENNMKQSLTGISIKRHIYHGFGQIRAILHPNIDFEVNN